MLLFHQDRMISLNLCAFHVEILSGIENFQAYDYIDARICLMNALPKFLYFLEDIAVSHWPGKSEQDAVRTLSQLGYHTLG